MKTLCVHENGSAVVFLDLTELQRLNQSLDINEIKMLSEIVDFRIRSIQKTKNILSDKKFGLFPKAIELADAEIEKYQRLNEKLLKLLEALCIM
jgi:hypothetical protein